MKTNISALMLIISEEEKNLSNLLYSIKDYIYTTKVTELDGKENVIEDTKEIFNSKISDITTTTEKLSKLKKILYEKNNNLKLTDGRTIQQAIVDNTNLRKLKQCYETLLNYKNTKKRVSEVNNSYFETRELNYNLDEIKTKLKEVTEEIQNTDFEISKLNSEEFTI